MVNTDDNNQREITEEESCYFCMWNNGGDEVKHEYKLTLTIGQMNLLMSAIQDYKYKSLPRYCKKTRIYYAESGLSEQNCDIVSAKIGQVQMNIYKYIKSLTRGKV